MYTYVRNTCKSKIRRAQAQHVLLGRCHFSRKEEIQNREKIHFGATQTGDIIARIYGSNIQLI